MIIPHEIIRSAHGEDRSNFQPVTPWTGLDFGWCKATEGTGFTDATFADNWRNLKITGIPRGAYHFFHPAENPQIQARFFVGTVMRQGLMPGDFLVCDSEITAGGPLAKIRRAFGIKDRLLPRQNVPAVTDRLTSAWVDTATKQFLDEVANLVGPYHPVLVYSNLSVGSLLRSCTDYELIIAFPSSTAPESVRPWRSWRCWQWGVVSNVDRDAFNGTVADLHAWIDRYKPKPKPKPKPPAMTLPGDNMFLPTGAGSEASYLAPAFVLGPDGPVAPTVMRFTSDDSADLEYNFSAFGPREPFSPRLDFRTSPWELPLDGHKVVKIRRTDAGTNPVSYDFA